MKILHLTAIAVLGLIIYSNTLHVPFQWDENFTIAENPITKDLRYFLDPGSAKDFGLRYYSFRDRYVGYLTFALNYKVHGLNVMGYHVVNIFLHLLNSFLVYYFVVLLFRSHFLQTSKLSGWSGLLAFLTGLLFVSHPIQTEAVNYIMGRLPLLMSFFYLNSIVLYVKWRLGREVIARKYPEPVEGATKQSKSFLFYILSLLSAVLAMKTKENAFTLPLMILLVDLFFFEGGRKRWTYLAPFLLTLLIVPFTLFDAKLSVGEILGGVDSATRHYTADRIPRAGYLYTQFGVIVTYIRLFFLPINQNFDYDQPVYLSPFNPAALFSLVLLCLIFGLGIRLYLRSSSQRPEFRLISFGIFWFFIALSVESSIFPIPMIICEYRAYLPSVGFFIALLAGGGLIAGSLPDRYRKAAVVLIFALPFVLGATSYARNNVWKSGVSLWEDAVRKSPGKARPYSNLGSAYYDAGMHEKAIENFRTAIKLKPNYADAYANMGMAYISKGMVREAADNFEKAISINPEHPIARNNLGIAYFELGMLDKAEEHLNIAFKLRPKEPRVLFNMGNLYKSKGEYEKAIGYYEDSLRIERKDAEVHDGLGAAYFQAGMAEKAVEHFIEAIRLKEDYVEAYNDLALVYMSINAVDKAIEYLEAAVRLNPAYADAHFNLGLAYLEKGAVEKARAELIMAIEINPYDAEARAHLNEIEKAGR